MAEITITHTHADGTTVDGSVPGDGVLEILQGCGFTYRSTVGIFVKGSRDRDANRPRIHRAAALLRDAGHTVTVEIDNQHRTAGERRADQAARADDKIDRLEGRAERAAGEARQRREAARDIGNGIPLAQPVQPEGHHSRAGHLRDLARMENHDRKSHEAADRSRYLAARADGVRANAEHRENPPAMMRRIEKLEADCRGYERELKGYTREQKNGHGVVIDRDVFPPATGDRADDLNRWHARDTEEIAHLRGLLAELEQSGQFAAWGREHFKVDDLVRTGGVWVRVRRVNTKSVSTPSIFGTADGRESTWNETIKWDQVTGRRRDGLQLDTPNGEPWPVELAVKVARWRNLLGTGRGARWDSPEAWAGRYVEYAQRMVHGLELGASDAQIKTITDSITGVDDRRALAAAYLAVFDRLQAGETVPDIVATLTPITGTPAWELPTDREPEDVRVDRLQPGDLVAGEWERTYGGGRNLHRGFCGPVQHVSGVVNRREAGDWVTVTLTTGAAHEFQTHRWLAVYRTADAVTEPATEETTPDAEPVTEVTPAPPVAERTNVEIVMAVRAVLALAADRWPTGCGWLKRAEVRQTLLTLAADHTGTPEGAALTAEADLYEGDDETFGDETTWARVRGSLLDHAAYYGSAYTHERACKVCDAWQVPLFSRAAPVPFVSAWGYRLAGAR